MQFVRADFVQRGPVFDVLRAGGPIYNGRTSIHGDVYLVLYANGVIEAYAHFVNNWWSTRSVATCSRKRHRAMTVP